MEQPHTQAYCCQTGYCTGRPVLGGVVRGQEPFFKINTDGTGFVTLYSFSGSDGAKPFASIILSGNTLYGTTSVGGPFGQGTIFAVQTDGTAFKTLYGFSAMQGGTNTDGAQPQCTLVMSGNTLYGTTLLGGSAGDGTAFSLNSDGTSFMNLHNFTGTNSDGIGPYPALIVSGTTLYGTTYRGGTSGHGTVFSIALSSAEPPQLTIVPSNANVILAWPSNTSGFFLQSATNLASPIWTTNLPSPVVVNGQFTVTNPISGTQQFFRLSQ